MLYRLVLALRHLAYDKGWIKSVEASVPTISIGNITVGGTGKTPHVELLLRYFVEEPGVAVLSRGYGRKSKGFQKVEAGSSASLAGDEPLQIAQKFPLVRVAVCKDRVEGCRQLAETSRLVVLDDAFQYRRLKPSLSIVLVDFNRPVFKDKLLPWGRLRDLPSRISAADIVIVTKCPPDEEPDRGYWRRQLKLREDQLIVFSSIEYCPPEPVFPDADPRYIYSQRLILVTGIANDKPLISYLSDTYRLVQRLSFPDHHNFSKRDVRSILYAHKENPTACIMTTEKDAQRLREVADMPEKLRQRLYFVPIRARFISAQDEEAFKSRLQPFLSNAELRLFY